MRARKPSGLGSSPSSGRIGLAVLLATCAAFLLIPAAQAAAAGTFNLNVVGPGSGEVSSEGPASSQGTPPIACEYNGEAASGVCSNEMFFSAANERDQIELLSFAAAGSEVGTVTVEPAGEDVTEEAFGPGYKCSGEGQVELEEFFGGWYCAIASPPEAGAEATVCFVLEGEGEAGCAAEPATEGPFELKFEGNGSATVSSEGPASSQGTPPLACEYNGETESASGTCSNAMFYSVANERDQIELLVFAEPGTTINTIVVEPEGEDVTEEAFGPGYKCSGEGQVELTEFFGGWYCAIAAPGGAGASATVVLEAEPETEGPFELKFEGNGSATVSSEGPASSQGTPPLACEYNGETEEASGVCENKMFYSEANERDQIELLVFAAPGTTINTIIVEPEGKDVTEEAFGPGFKCSGEGQPELEEFFGGWYCAITAPGGAGASATVVLEGEGTPNLKVNIEEGEGSVVSSPAGIECAEAEGEGCAAEFEAGKAVTLTASPAPGYLFKSWKKCDKKEGEFGVNGRQCTVKSTEEMKEVGAKFVKVWNLTISKAGGLGIAKTKPGGIVCLYACLSATAAYKDIAWPGGKPVEVAVKPAKRFHFVEYLNGTGQTEACNGKNAEEGCVYSPSGEDSSIETLFEEDPKNILSLAKTGGGQAFIKTKPAGVLCGYTCSAAEAEYYAADTALVSIKLNKGTSKLEWTSGAGTCTGTVEVTESTCEVPMSEAHALVADLS